MQPVLSIIAVAYGLKKKKKTLKNWNVPNTVNIMF